MNGCWIYTTTFEIATDRPDHWKCPICGYVIAYEEVDCTNLGCSGTRPEEYWECSECGKTNWSEGSKCAKRGCIGVRLEKKHDVIESDWTCDTDWCHCKNGAKRITCSRCSKFKSGVPETWFCSSCESLNSSRHDLCFACSSNKPKMPHIPKPESERTPWFCTRRCGHMNPAKYRFCEKCGEHF